MAQDKRGHFFEDNERFLGVSRVLESGPPRYCVSERDGRRGALGRRPPQRRGGGFVRKERLGRFVGRQLRKDLAHAFLKEFASGGVGALQTTKHARPGAEAGSGQVQVSKDLAAPHDASQSTTLY